MRVRFNGSELGINRVVSGRLGMKLYGDHVFYETGIELSLESLNVNDQERKLGGEAAIKKGDNVTLHYPAVHIEKKSNNRNIQVHTRVKADPNQFKIAVAEVPMLVWGDSRDFVTVNCIACNDFLVKDIEIITELIVFD